MKKYIAPVAKNINLQSEGSLLTPSNFYNTEGYSEASNRRSASSVIWGFDDGVVVEDEY